MVTKKNWKRKKILDILTSSSKKKNTEGHEYENYAAWLERDVRNLELKENRMITKKESSEKGFWNQTNRQPEKRET